MRQIFLQRLLASLALCVGFSFSLVAAGITISGDFSTSGKVFFRGGQYNVTWSATADIASNTFDIFLYDNVLFGTDKLISTYARSAPGFNLPITMGLVTPDNSYYIKICVAGTTTCAQGVDVEVRQGSIQMVTPTKGAIFNTQEAVELNWRSNAGPNTMVRAYLCRLDVCSTVVESAPVVNPLIVTIPPNVAAASNYYFAVYFALDQAVFGNTELFTIQNLPVQSLSPTPTPTATANPTAEPTAEPTADPTPTVTPVVSESTSFAPSPTPALWAGKYQVNSGCDTDSCCCLTGVATVTQSGNNVVIVSSTQGQCAGSTTVTVRGTIESSDPNTIAADFGSFGQYIITRSGQSISIINVNASQCSGTATYLSAALALSPPPAITVVAVAVVLSVQLFI